MKVGCTRIKYNAVLVHTNVITIVKCFLINVTYCSVLAPADAVVSFYSPLSFDGSEDTLVASVCLTLGNIPLEGTECPVSVDILTVDDTASELLIAVYTACLLCHVFIRPGLHVQSILYTT